ncbi:MAG: hypothetical protein C5B54_09150 [Acidobacteria bacterium]|nr:MAG: hypothetical protein C5B54_09150 [Acidobacteriota bacterium]
MLPPGHPLGGGPATQGTGGSRQLVGGLFPAMPGQHPVVLFGGSFPCPCTPLAFFRLEPFGIRGRMTAFGPMLRIDRSGITDAVCTDRMRFDPRTVRFDVLDAAVPFIRMDVGFAFFRDCGFAGNAVG